MKSTGHDHICDINPSIIEDQDIDMEAIVNMTDVQLMNKLSER